METHGLRLALVEAPTGIVHGMWAAHSEPQVIGPFPPDHNPTVGPYQARAVRGSLHSVPPINSFFFVLGMRKARQ
jgi:hypothetical protein